VSLSVESKSHLLWFCVKRFVIGLKFSRHFLIQSENQKQSRLARARINIDTDHAILKPPIATNATNQSELEEKNAQGVKGGKTHGRRQ